MNAINFVALVAATGGSFAATATLLMVSVAYPAAAMAIYAILMIGCVCGLIWWLIDGDLRTGLAGGAIAFGVILGAAAKWRGMVG